MTSILHTVLQLSNSEFIVQVTWTVDVVLIRFHLIFTWFLHFKQTLQCLRMWLPLNQACSNSALCCHLANSIFLLLLLLCQSFWMLHQVWACTPGHQNMTKTHECTCILLHEKGTFCVFCRNDLWLECVSPLLKPYLRKENILNVFLFHFKCFWKPSENDAVILHWSCDTAF